MNILNKLTIKNFSLNKKRSIGTILGIILSVALICAVGGMFSSLHQTLIRDAINQGGYYHLGLKRVTKKDLEILKNNRDINKINVVNQIGYTPLKNGENEYKPYMFINSMNEQTFNELNFKLLNGRFPKNSNEIVISEFVLSDAKVDYKIGDKITVSLGNRVNDGEIIGDNNNNPYIPGETLKFFEEKEYEIVGIIERPNYSFESYDAPGYTVITTETESDNLTVYLSLKKPKEYKKAISSILGVDNYGSLINIDTAKLNYPYFIINDNLLKWEVFAFSDSTVSMLLGIIAVVMSIIVLTSVYCIKNSFEISTTEKMKMYGMLSSVGATKKQIKKSVINEGLLLGLIGIPVGILCGILAVFILVCIVNEFFGEIFLTDTIFVFSVSLEAIAVSVLLGLVTIYVSSLSSARKASRINPIENLRSNNEIKIKSSKIRTPKIINKIFKIGGVLAYKNLKRSKKKYRTTVVSLTICILTFITMNTFINEGFVQSNNYYYDLDYNLVVEGSVQSYNDEQLNKLLAINDEERFVIYEDSNDYQIKDKEKVNIYSDEGSTFFCKPEQEICENDHISIVVLPMDDATFRKYAKKINANYDHIKDKAILIDEIEYYSNTKDKTIKKRRYKYKNGDTIVSYRNNEKVEFEIGKVTKERPYGFEMMYYDGGYLVVNKEYFNNDKIKPYMVLFQSENSGELKKEIDILDDELNVHDINESVRAMKSFVILISIFLYGFITVITLIGVTNIFNTITSNVELRSKEFAMLKSVGMTKKEFDRMINLETLFYSTKSLFYGIILGIAGSYLVHIAFSSEIETVFELPITAIIISIVFVFVLVYIIMKYSVSKINKQNTIETIRKDNI